MVSIMLEAKETTEQPEMDLEEAEETEFFATNQDMIPSSAIKDGYHKTSRITQQVLYLLIIRTLFKTNKILVLRRTT